MYLSEIKSDIDFLCGTTSATYADADKLRNINIAYQDVARVIWESAGGWHYDDSNNTSTPIVKTTLTHNQQEVTLPTTAQRIHEIAVLDNAGSWHKLLPIDIHDMSGIAPQEFQATPGLPLYYELVGRKAVFYPAVASGAVTLASGAAFFVDRDITKLTASSSTPGFATPFHRILSYAAAMDFQTDKDELQKLAAQKARLETGMSRFYSKRMVEYQTQIKPASKKRWRLYT